MVIALAAVCVIVGVLYRRRGGPNWPMAFAASLFVVGVLQVVLGSLCVVGPHLFLGVLYLGAVTTFCSYAWRHQPRSVSSTA